MSWNYDSSLKLLFKFLYIFVFLLFVSIFPLNFDFFIAFLLVYACIKVRWCFLRERTWCSWIWNPYRKWVECKKQWETKLNGQVMEDIKEINLPTLKPLLFRLIGAAIVYESKKCTNGTEELMGIILIHGLAPKKSTFDT